jgi:hypothetical protein
MRDPDEHPTASLPEVGPWAKDKLKRLRDYLSA